MSETAIVDLVIRRGVDFARTFELRHGLILRGLVVKGATAIRFDPMAIDLPANTALNFVDASGVETQLTTSAIAPAGVRMVSINAYTGSTRIINGAVAPTLIKDLTGYTWKSSVKITYLENARKLTLSTTTDSAAGLVTVSATAAQTWSLPPNASDIEVDDYQRRAITSQDFLQRSYFWDLEGYFGGESHRLLSGRAWNTWGATSYA